MIGYKELLQCVLIVLDRELLLVDCFFLLATFIGTAVETLVLKD